MEHFQLISIFLFVLFLLLGTGVWVGFALIGVAIVGMELFTSRPAGDAMLTAIWASSTSWSLTALPLFIWMGEILFRTKLSQDLFKGLSPWMSGLPGGLLHTNIVGCTIFAAVSGSSAATLTTVGKMSIPELEKRNYPRHLIIGIPPSLTLIVYGVTINESISKLFLAGIMPGLFLAAMFMLYVVIYSLIKGRQDIIVDGAKTFKEKLVASRFLIPVLLLVLFVIGSMYSGVATATEAASFGVIGAFILACVQGSMNLETFKASILGAVSTSAMIALILMGASFLSLSMGFTGLPRALAEWIATMELTRFELLMALLVFYIIIGCFLDGISAVVLTIAIVEPMIRQAGIDIIWFGIFIVVVVEMAQITPPIGFNLFVLQGMTGHQIGYIARTAVPMFLIMLLMIFVLIALPELATWLPEKMNARP